jgi:hypothetical protein
MTSKFLAVKVRPANREIPRGPDATLPTRWLPAEWPDDADEPTDYRMSNMDDHTPLRALQLLLAVITGACHTRGQTLEPPEPAPT